MTAPFKSKRPYLGALALGIVVLVTVVSRIGSAQDPQPSADSVSKLPEAETTIRAFVQSAIDANRESKTVMEWTASGYLPEDIFENVRDRAKLDPQAWNSLCRVFLSLDDSGLALFQSEIEKPENQSALSCSPALKSRFKAYMRAQRAELRTFVEADHELNGWVDKDGEDEEHTVPSEEVQVDASKGETLWGSAKEGFVKENQIAITIDDGPHPVYTRQILNTLKYYGVRANFFSVGNPAHTWPALVKAEIEEGHMTGSHTMDHPDLVVKARSDVKGADREITNGRKTVAEAAGIDIPFFRFPYGSGAHNADLVNFVKNQGMASFMWNMDSSDWKIHSAVDLFKNMKAELSRAKGGIMLMHDIHPQTALALPHLLDELRHRHFSTILFVPH